MIGDSRVRYQYMNLAAFLELERWMHCREFKTDAPDDDSCFLFGGNKDQSRSWEEWYDRSNQELTSSSSSSSSSRQTTTTTTTNNNISNHQTEWCACFRDVSFSPKEVLENRYLHRMTRHGPIQITYLQNFIGTLTFYPGFPPLLTTSNNTSTNTTHAITDSGDDFYPPCRPGLCNITRQPVKSNVQVYQMADALESMIPRLQPTHLFAVNGWHEKEISCELQQYAQQHNIYTAAMTHPAERQPPRQRKGGKPTKRRLSVSSSIRCPRVPVLDRHELSVGAPRELYRDKKHSLSTLNREFNYKLLEMICDW